MTATTKPQFPTAYEFVRSLGTVAADETLTVDLDAVSQKLFGRVVVQNFQFDTLAVWLANNNREAYEKFVEWFPFADAGRFIA
jgi:hypothetical protein